MERVGELMIFSARECVISMIQISHLPAVPFYTTPFGYLEMYLRVVCIR